MLSNGAGHEEGGSSNKLEGEKTQKVGDNVGKGHVRGPKTGNTSGQQRK